MLKYAQREENQLLIVKIARSTEIILQNWHRMNRRMVRRRMVRWMICMKRIKIEKWLHLAGNRIIQKNRVKQK